MKLYKTIFIALFALPMMMAAQEVQDTIAVQEEQVAEVQDTIAPATVELERAAFESTSLIESQTNRVYSKGTIEMIMNHRFGLVNGTNDMIGIWAPSNIRIALNYSITDRITVGFGTTKDARLLDFSLKAAIFRQTVGNKMPFSITYYGNFANSTLSKVNFINTSNRFSFFNQLIIAKRFSKAISFQIAPSVSHFNALDASMKNDLFSIAIGGRAKITSDMSILLESNQPLTKQANNPKPGLSTGVEFSTVGHTFQIFVTNYRGIINQQSIMFNQNDFFSGDFAIGFNISRTW
ncbi:MAG: DUF5777 family beta-barrel protein [Flavobacterium sp.]|uniref:DUF5777 family beta-barrel protein n=1 Tax=Flavobacterium sp. TaxID=239 RepID=UPI0026113545|nr:DUF5777 family beta-barrel protein [Flavobacterium sp.]MDD5149950.1 DUF5777 family beta-barrel protein [Flavobacterium sp.]